MQNEETLAALTSSPENSSETSVESLLNTYSDQEHLRAERRRTTIQPAQRTAILDDLSDILYLRGHLQQMGASFSSSGELLTYGNPPSPTDFEDMLKLGPMYEEQWATFFVEGYVPHSSGSEDGDGYLWSDFRTLKKMLSNEGVVFGREHQRYSFGDSSTKLRRLCCAYDKLRMEWLECMRTSLPVHDDADLARVVDGDEQVVEGDSGFVDGSSPRRQEYEYIQLDPDQPYIAGRPPIIKVRSSGVVRNIGWRFSDDLTPPPQTNAWRFSDNLESVPAWKDVHEATATATQVENATQTVQEADEDTRENNPIVLHTIVDEDVVSPPPVPATDNRKSIYPASNGVFGSEIFAVTAATPALTYPTKRISMIRGPSPLQVSLDPISKACDHLLTKPQHLKSPSMTTNDALAMNPRGDNPHIDPVLTTYIENAVIVNVQEPTQERAGKKVRRWFKETFGRK
jgi:hypothetical protein